MNKDIFENFMSIQIFFFLGGGVNTFPWKVLPVGLKHPHLPINPFFPKTEKFWFIPTETFSFQKNLVCSKEVLTLNNQHISIGFHSYFLI